MRVFRIVCLVCLLPGTLQAQDTYVQMREVANYRLTLPVFERFVAASTQIAAAIRGNPAFELSPLFTREIAVSGDAAMMATELAERLTNARDLAAIVQGAKLTPREYATFALVLLGAHMAHGFAESGALTRVPPGIPADNVSFVVAHEARVTAVLAVLGIAK